MAVMALYSSCAPFMVSSRQYPAKPSSLASSRSRFFAADRGRAPLFLSTQTLSLRRRLARSGGLGCRCLFGLGVPELVVIAGVVALVFGPKKLPEIGRSIGKTVKSFQQAAKEFETELKKDTEGSSEPPPAESSKAVSSEDEKKQLETSGTNESL